MKCKFCKAEFSDEVCKLHEARCEKNPVIKKATKTPDGGKKDGKNTGSGDDGN